MTLRMMKDNANATSSKSAAISDATLIKKAVDSDTTDQCEWTSPPLKRKPIEEPATYPKTINPPKRFNSGTRMLQNVLPHNSELVPRKGSPESANHCVPVDTPKYVDNAAEDGNIMDFELPVLIENDGNVEKAEACSKELSVICSMLKKKHDEAKELLVRAIVNNNTLLMLSHPMMEEKIRALQRFTTNLQSKEHWKN